MTGRAESFCFNKLKIKWIWEGWAIFIFLKHIIILSSKRKLNIMDRSHYWIFTELNNLSLFYTSVITTVTQRSILKWRCTVGSRGIFLLYFWEYDITFLRVTLECSFEENTLRTTELRYSGGNGARSVTPHFRH